MLRKKLCFLYKQVYFVYKQCIPGMLLNNAYKDCWEIMFEKSKNGDNVENFQKKKIINQCMNV